MVKISSLIAIAALASTLLLGGCASEQSPEAREREETERSLARLSFAEGDFRGYIVTGANASVPFSLSQRVIRNPIAGQQQPSLRSVFTVGLFGGSQLTTTDVTVDFGARQLIARFSSKGAGQQLKPGNALQRNLVAAASMQTQEFEIRAMIDQTQGLQQATLDASSGRYDMIYVDQNIEPLQLSGKQTWSFFTQWQVGGKAGSAKLEIKRDGQQISAPEGFDLPSMPSLQATLSFPGFSQTPQVAKRVFYDPLRGNLEIVWREENASRLILEELFAPGGETAGLELDSQKAVLGQIRMGSLTTAHVSLYALSERRESGASLSMPLRFTGSYQARANAPVFGVVGLIEPSGTSTSNSSENPFEVFPNLRLTIYICDGGQVQVRRDYELTAVDYLTREMSWVNSRQANRELKSWFDEQLETMTATFIDPSSASTVASSGKTINLQANLRLAENTTCSYFGSP